MAKASKAAATKTGGLPMADYFSALGYLSFLLASCVIFLPRSTAYFYKTGVQQKTSADRPEHPFLTPITSNPAASVAWATAGVVFTMGWWGGKMARYWSAPQTDGSRTRDAILGTLGVSMILLLLLTLLGAPSSKFLETAQFALYLGTLTAWPILYTLGVPSVYDDGIAARYRLTRLVCAWQAETALERALAYPMAGALVGAWVGAIPLALDWDRPWQSWPLPPLVGTTVGFIAGGYVSFAFTAMGSLRDQVKEEQKANAPPVAAKKRKGKKA